MKKLISFVTLLFCFFTISCSNDAKSETKEIDLVGPVGVNIPYGESTWSTTINPVSVNPLRFLYWRTTSQCTITPTVGLNVRYSGQSYWASTKASNQGLFYHDGGVIDGVKLNFYQNETSNAFCMIKISGVLTDPPPPTPNPNYVGHINFYGGYLYRAPVSFDIKTVQTFLVKVPENCNGLEITEVGSTVNNQFIAAKYQNTQNPLQYSFSNPLTIDKLLVSFNGPRDLKCDIPVYIY